MKPPRIPVGAKILFTLIGAVTIAVGLSAIGTEFAPARSTRFGMAGALYGSAAQHFGLTVVLVGLMPLGLLFERPRLAGAWATVAGLAALVSLVWGFSIR